MNGTRTFQLLRIIASAVCLILCVLLIGLWIRSYWQFDQVIRRLSTTDYAAFTSVQGQLVFGKSNEPMLRRVFQQVWTYRGFRMSEWDAALRGPVAFFPATAPGPRDSKRIRRPSYSTEPFLVFTPGVRYTELILPYWMLFLSVAALGAAPWIRWRFSLRTLLLSISVVSVVLGMVAYWSR